MARIIVTGVSGFVGKHLVRELASRGDEVFGIGLQPKAGPAIADLLTGYLACDLTDPEQVREIPLDGVEAAISLAGLAQVGASFEDPDRYKQVNVAVLSVLAERILSEKHTVKILAISTGAVYDPNQALPLGEVSKLTPKGSPYAVSKILMEKKAEELRQRGLDCVIARPFNHIGPGQEPGFLVPDLYSKITKSLKDNSPLLVGNLKTKRDYTDVRDVVRAYADLVRRPRLGHSLYNVCSGRSVQGEKILEILLAACGATDKVKVRVDESLIRPDDPVDLYGSHDRLTAETGWQPKFEIARTIIDYAKSAR